LLISEPERSSLRVALQMLKQISSAKLRHTVFPSGEGPIRFWQVRYYDFNVKTAKKRIEKLRYLHRNPVRRGFVEKPEDWVWSSYRHYQTGIRRIVEIESEWTARQRGWQLPAWMPDRRSGFSTSPVPKSEGSGHPEPHKSPFLRFQGPADPPAH